MNETDGKIPVLLRMIAHDVKGLLGTPGILIHLAETAEGDERARVLVALSEAFKAIDRALTDIGDVGSMLGAPGAPNLQRIDMRELLTNSIALARGAGALRKLELVEEIAPGPWPPVLGEAGVLGRAIERLVFWGVTHAAADSRVVIEGRIEDGSVLVRVPAGRGVPDSVPTVQERLEELALGNRGLGIALPLARDAFERSGGSLEVGAGGVLEARIPAASG